MGASLDFIIKNGEIVLPDRVEKMDIGIKDGKIVSMEPDLRCDSDRIVDADGLIVMPGMIDVHVHLNEPGLEEWEGFRTGSAALAAGGCTTCFDMPLNSIPPTVTEAALDAKRSAARGNCHIDYALWGGLMPGHLDELDKLSKAGVIGFKAFMSAPGDPSEDAFREVDDLTLLEGMRRIAGLNKVLALHAESEPLISQLTDEAVSKGWLTPEAFCQSRPIVAELEAVNRALFYAEQTGCPIHFVHISSIEAVKSITAAKQRGIAATLETCPHYLLLTDDDMARLGPVAKCAPPLRSQANREQLWEAVRHGLIDMISSDHSPCPPNLKESDNFFEVWGGIAGAQSSMELLIGEGHIQRGIPLPQLSRLLSLSPAQRFGLHPRKGEIRIGADADLAFVRLNDSYELKSEQLLQKHKISPYVGRTFNCKIVSTFVRGRVVYEERRGIPHADGQGEWVSLRKGAAIDDGLE